MEQFSKRPVLLLWLEGATFHWVFGYKFNIYNEYLTGIKIKVNVKDISVNNTNKSYDKKSTKKSEVSFG